MVNGKTAVVWSVRTKSMKKVGGEVYAGVGIIRLLYAGCYARCLNDGDGGSFGWGGPSASAGVPAFIRITVEHPYSLKQQSLFTKQLLSHHSS